MDVSGHLHKVDNEAEARRLGMVLVNRELTTWERRTQKIGRNSPCGCGSGIKFKKCCIGKDQGKSGAAQDDKRTDCYGAELPPISESDGALYAKVSAGTDVQWQSMETAPMDGTRVLLYRPTTPFVWMRIGAGSYSDDRFATKPRPYWASDNWSLKREQRDSQPTHWMPLPEAPK